MVIVSGALLPLVRHIGTTPARAFPCFRYGYVLIASVCVACATPAPPGAEDVSTATTLADTGLQGYQLRALETHIQTMPDGPEREYFSGMLAARSGRFGDAVAQLKRAMPHLRKSNPKRAAMALEAIATVYRADNQYGDAARAYAELSDHFANQFGSSFTDAPPTLTLSHHSCNRAGQPLAPRAARLHAALLADKDIYF